jgi:putative pyruvate formate lyase activating enzyme
MSQRSLKDRSDRLTEILADCVLCPHECHAARTKGEFGVCRSSDEVVISSASPHYGEEPPLVGFHGSGTIFFTSCNMKCQFCQNYEISQLRFGRQIAIERLADIMLSLQETGCHNINLVTPTHFVPQIITALTIASERGLNVPIVYNCGGYESLQVIQLLDGIVDIYMPDVKYSSNDAARRFSGARDYWDVVRPVIREMQRQVGELQTDGRGVATRGLLIRHLVLPNDIAGSKKVLEFIAREISPGSYVNIMDQYRPVLHAHRYKELDRPITTGEYRDVLRYASEVGLSRGFDLPDREEPVFRFAQ